jgi:hypothetical protein
VSAPAWTAVLAAGNAVSLLSVTQNPRPESHQAVTAREEMPRQGPAAFLAGLILPHPEFASVAMSEICPVSSPSAVRA